MYGSKERPNSKEQIRPASPEQLRPTPGSRETSGGLEWDHFSDVSRVTSVPHNSVEAPAGAPKSGEERTSRSQEEANKREELPQEDVSFQSDEGSFYDDGSKDRFSENFDSADFEHMFGFSSGEHDASNSIELPFSSSDAFGRNKPVATSYAKFSSVFAKPRAVAPQGRDLLHPVNTNNNVPNYVQSQGRTPISHFRYFNNNGLNISKQNLNHDGRQEERDPGVLQINHGVTHVRPMSRNGGPNNQDHPTKSPNPFVPANHPVYKYVRNHGGNPQNQQLHQNQAAARWQQPAGQYRTNNQPQPPEHFFVHNQETVVQHFVPTKSPFSDTYWKESKKIERLQPPPALLAPHPYKFTQNPTKLAPNPTKLPPRPSKLAPTSISPTGHSYLIFKKKPNSSVDLKRINRRQGSNYVYIIRRDKRFTK